MIIADIKLRARVGFTNVKCSIVYGKLYCTPSVAYVIAVASNMTFAGDNVRPSGNCPGRSGSTIGRAQKARLTHLM